MFTGCGKKDAEPVVSEIVEEIEEAEPVEETEPVEEVETAEPTEVSNGEYNGAGEDVEVDGEVVEGSTLTQEEIDELKASGDSSFQMALDAYEAITSGGTYTASSTGVVFDKVVGTPGEDGWVRVDASKGTIYFDEEAWLAAASASVPPKNEIVMDDRPDEYWYE